jgi:Uma2 family endonuclease
MAGGSPDHSRITLKLGRHIDAQLDGTPCEGFSSDTALRVEQYNEYLYPDISVSRGGARFDDSTHRILLNPTLVIEVLSPSSERTDRSLKLDAYLSLESLKTYVLVSQDRPRVETYTRQPNNTWLYESIIGLDAVVVLHAIGCTVRLADIYARVTLPSPSDLHVDNGAE